MKIKFFLKIENLIFNLIYLFSAILIEKNLI